MSTFAWVAAFVLSVVASARITRLVVFDHWPPAVWFRMKWDQWTNDGPWSFLVHCGYCFNVWAALAVVGSGWLSDWHTAWWLVTGWLSVSYLGAVFVAFDGDDD